MRSSIWDRLSPGKSYEGTNAHSNGLAGGSMAFAGGQVGDDLAAAPSNHYRRGSSTHDNSKSAISSIWTSTMTRSTHEMDDSSPRYANVSSSSRVAGAPSLRSNQTRKSFFFYRRNAKDRSKEEVPPLPTPPPLPPPASRPPLEDSSKSLATRLQELAIANADGLLDEDEYRILRAQLFEQYAAKSSTSSAQSHSSGVPDHGATVLGQGNEQVPRLTNRRSNGSLNPTNQAPRFADSSLPPPLPPSSPALSSASLATVRPEANGASSAETGSLRRAPSSILSSGRSISGIFRRASGSIRSGITSRSSLFDSKKVAADESWTIVDGPKDDIAQPLPSSLSTDHRRNPSIPSSYSFPASLNHISISTTTADQEPFRPRSIRNHPALSSSALTSPGSLRDGSGGGWAEGSVRSSSSSIDGRIGSGAPRSHASFSRSSLSGWRSTSGLSPSPSQNGFLAKSSGTSSSHSQPIRPSVLPPIASSKDPFLFASVDREPTSFELRKEISELEDEQARVRETYDGAAKGALGKWEGVVDENVRREFETFRRRKAEMSIAGGEGGTSPILNGNKSSSGATKTSSFMTPLSRSLSTSKLQLVEAPPSAPMTIAASQDVLISTILSNDFVPPASLSEEHVTATNALRTELIELGNRRRATDERYVRRLNYLHSKLKGAQLKEGFPG